MSRHSDVTKMIHLALSRGLIVRRAKHGGYAILRHEDDVEVVTHIPANGHGAPHWMKRVKRDIERA